MIIPNKYTGINPDNNNVFAEHIIAQKVFDQCRSQGCIEQGPVISNEKCECFIIKPDINAYDIGKIILPDKPIRLPEWVKSLKYIKDSFKIRNITVPEITPSPLKGYWDICVEFIFDFKLQLFGEFMTPIKILCCPCDKDSSDGPDNIKDFISCSSLYIKQVTLFGSREDESNIASDLFELKDCGFNNSPHALVQAGAEPGEFKIVSPEEASFYKDLFDDIYHEPFNYIYAFIAMLIDIKLFRFVCMLVEAKACKPPKICEDAGDDPCAIFSRMDFPNEMFLP